eukprot:763247-Hanusia_phi.AAC.1
MALSRTRSLAYFKHLPDIAAARCMKSSSSRKVESLNLNAPWSFFMEFRIASFLCSSGKSCNPKSPEQSLGDTHLERIDLVGIKPSAHAAGIARRPRKHAFPFCPVPPHARGRDRDGSSPVPCPMLRGGREPRRRVSSCYKTARLRLLVVAVLRMTRRRV